MEKKIETIKGFEGCVLTAYQDGGGVWTAGFGSTGPDIVEGTVLTQDEADERLLAHVEKMMASVLKVVEFPMTENQECAICSLVYNIGFGNFKDSTLLKKLNNPMRDLEDVANEFLRWNKIKGVESDGLSNRRKAERALFLS